MAGLFFRQVRRHARDMSIRRFLLLVVALVLALLGWCYWTAIADPVVREAEVAPPGWPAGAPPVRAVLISDIHATGPDMPPERIGHIVAPDQRARSGRRPHRRRFSQRQ